MALEINYEDGQSPLDPNEMEGLKHKHVTTLAELNELEYINIRDGLRWLSLQKRPEIFTPDFITTLHLQLFGQVWSWAGTYRTTGKSVGVDPNRINQELYQLLDDVKFWTENNIYNPLEAVLRFHHKMVYIHPFPNGNGRFSRIIADTMMENIYNLPPLDWLQGADLQKKSERRDQYIAALRAADREDYSLLFEFIGDDCDRVK